MKIPKLKFKRWWKPSPAPPSSASDHQIPQSSHHPGSTLRSPQNFAALTIEIPNTSHTYHDMWLLRSYAKAFEWLFRNGPTPHKRLVLQLRYPIPVVIKYGTSVQLSEASTLRFLAKNTSIPVPKVYCAFQRKDVKYILMERVKGTDIGENWTWRPSIEKEKLLKQLKGYFDELRQVPHPRPGVICSLDRGPLFDPRIDEENVFGPFADEKDFVNFLRCGVVQGPDGGLGDIAESFFEGKQPQVRELISMQDKENNKICFTHGDAHSCNFLVRKDKIVAMIDFETSGFYPEYWEYTTAMTTAMNPAVFDDSCWKKEIVNFLKEYSRQMETEKVRQKLFGKLGFRCVGQQGGN